MIAAKMKTSVRILFMSLVIWCWFIVLKIFIEEICQFAHSFVHILWLPIALYMSCPVKNKQLLALGFRCLAECFISHIFCTRFSSCNHQQWLRNQVHVRCGVPSH